MILFNIVNFGLCNGLLGIRLNISFYWKTGCKGIGKLTNILLLDPYQV